MVNIGHFGKNVTQLKDTTLCDTNENQASTCRQVFLGGLLRAFAAAVLAFAAALEALIALSRRSFADNFFARARPPRLPISAMIRRMSSSSTMRRFYTVALRFHQ